jgi:hypothetical protein
MPHLDPESVFASFWATALQDAQFNETDAAFEEGREPVDIEGEPTPSRAEKYREGVRLICVGAESLIDAQNRNTFPKVCPDGDLDSVFGSDLYLTAVGHGAGFWDGDWDPVGDELTELVRVHAPSGDLCEHKDGGLFFI